MSFNWAAFEERVNQIAKDDRTPQDVACTAMMLGGFNPLSENDLSCLEKLVYWLFVYDRNEDAVALTGFVTGEPTLGMGAVAILTMRARLLRDRGECRAEYESALDQVRECYASREKRLLRELKGAGLFDERIKEYEDKGDTGQADYWRFRNLGQLNLISILGGSTDFSSYEAERRIAEIKDTLRGREKTRENITDGLTQAADSHRTTPYPKAKLTMRPIEKWLDAYRKKLSMLSCPADLNAYFTADEIAGKKLDRLTIGTVSLPTGKVHVFDPLVYLRPHSKPYFQAVRPGEYPVTLAVIVPDQSGDCARYAAARVRFADAEAVCYIEALTGTEDLLHLKEGEYFGFNVDAGLACICDTGAHEAFLAFEKKWNEENEDDLYDGYFKALFTESYNARPKYQREGGDWIDWHIPGTAYHIPIFASGFGDGAYPVYFGLDADGNIVSLVAQFIDVENAY